MKKYFWLVIILAFAAILRIYLINKVPPELFGDELDVGYHAYSILKTGKDYTGQFLPTYIHSLTEWRTPLLTYLTVPFIAVFGLNEWSVRLPSAVLGIVSILLLYLLVNKVTDSKKVALVSSLLLTISPWHIQYSRAAAFDATLLICLLLGGTFAFQSKKYLVSSVFFALTFYAYNTANIFTPLLIIFLVLLQFGELRKISWKKFILPTLVFSVISVPIAVNIIFGSAAERFSISSVFSDTTLIDTINIQRLEGGNNWIEKLVYNKPLVWGRKILSNYSSAFSPQFLFQEGDPTFRHSIHGMGELYWVMLPFLILGFIKITRQKEKSDLLWIGWLVLAPLPSSLTRDGAMHATRLFLMLPPLMVIAANGFDYLMSLKWKRLMVPLLVGVLVVEFGMYLERYYVHYPKESWRWWHVGYKEAMQFVSENEDGYGKIVFNNTYEPALLRFLFWTQYPPDKFLNEFVDDKSHEEILPGFDGFSLENRYYFGSVSKEGRVEDFVEPGMLYMVSQRDEVAGDWDWSVNPPGSIKVLKTIRNPYNEPIFYIVTKVN